MPFKRRPPKVNADMVGNHRGRIRAWGTYSQLPKGNFKHPQWAPFRVSFNHRWHVVKMVRHDERWGWEADELGVIQDEQEFSPPIEVRGPKQ
jgi:hypothetical protein